MKNYIKKMICFVLTLFLFVALCSCNENGSTSSKSLKSESGVPATAPTESSKNTESQSALSSITSGKNNAIVETWQEAYMVFLKDYPVGVIENENSFFSLKDLDNNGVPELLIEKLDKNTSDGILKAYSYDKSVYEIGEYTNPKIGVAGLRISNNPQYSGMFTLWYGGGVEHFGYLTIKKGKLYHEDLYILDLTGDSPVIKEISSNKELIKESIDAHPPYEYTENLLDMYPINEDNIAKIIKETTNSRETSDAALSKEVTTVFTFSVNENMPSYECIFVNNNSGPRIMFLNDDDAESGYFNDIIINDNSGNQIQIISLSDFSGMGNLMFDFFDINSDGNMDLTLQQFAADKINSYEYVWDDTKNKFNEVPETHVYQAS